jgi:hypothetical protein
MAKIGGGKVYRETSSAILLNICDRKACECTLSRQLAKFDGSKLYQGTSSTQLTHIDSGKIERNKFHTNWENLWTGN